MAAWDREFRAVVMHLAYTRQLTLVTDQEHA